MIDPLWCTSDISQLNQTEYHSTKHHNVHDNDIAFHSSDVNVVPTSLSVWSWFRIIPHDIFHERKQFICLQLSITIGSNVENEYQWFHDIDARLKATCIDVQFVKFHHDDNTWTTGTKFVLSSFTAFQFSYTQPHWQRFNTTEDTLNHEHPFHQSFNT